MYIKNKYLKAREVVGYNIRSTEPTLKILKLLTRTIGVKQS